MIVVVRESELSNVITFGFFFFVFDVEVDVFMEWDLY